MNSGDIMPEKIMLEVIQKFLEENRVEILKRVEEKIKEIRSQSEKPEA